MVAPRAGYTCPDMADASFEAAFDRALGQLNNGQPDQAHATMAPFHEEGLQAPQRAADLLRLWQATPDAPQLVQRVGELATAHVRDPQLVLIACDALIRAAERVPPDEPPAQGGPALAAVDLAQQGLSALAESARGTETHAFLQMAYGNALRLAHLFDRAKSAMESALKKRPDHGPWWFNLGLLHKQQRDFAAGLEANQRAQALLGKDHRAVLWNLAICATAVGKGELAVGAFEQLGLQGVGLAPSGMPQIAHMPPVQVRVATVGPGHMGPSHVPDTAVGMELVWVNPLGPCHGVVASPTYRQGSVDYGDVVLWDAVPVGVSRSPEGAPVPRFPLLARLRAGDEHRFRFVALERKSGAITTLEGPLEPTGQLFVHRERVSTRLDPEQPSGPANLATGELVYGKVVLPGDADLQAFRKEFERQVQQADVELVIPELLEVLGDTPAAGKAHTLWRGLERTVEKKRSGKSGDLT